MKKACDGKERGLRVGEKKRRAMLVKRLCLGRSQRARKGHTSAFLQGGTGVVEWWNSCRLGPASPLWSGPPLVHWIWTDGRAARDLDRARPRQGGENWRCAARFWTTAAGFQPTGGGRRRGVIEFRVAVLCLWGPEWQKAGAIVCFRKAKKDEPAGPIVNRFSLFGFQ